MPSRLIRSPYTLWVAFVAVHFWLGCQGLFGPGYPLGDVEWVYTRWVEAGLTGGFWVGIDAPWVYPILALGPMIAAHAFGAALYAPTWLSLIMILDAAAFALLVARGVRGDGRSAGRRHAAWWWLGFLALLGPVALGRIDAVTVPIAIAGMLVLATRPRLAVVLLALATWVKVWPAVLLGAVLVTRRDAAGRRTTIGVALAVTLGVAGVALILGAGPNVVGFIGEQAGRGLQVEAPVGTPWLWAVASGSTSTTVAYSQEILTYQLYGPGVDVASALMTPLLVVVAAGILLLGFLAVRRGTRAVRVLSPLVLALVLVLLLFNKVGSPQFVAWLAVPAVFGLVQARRGGPSFLIPALGLLVVSGLTQLIYPTFYAQFLGATPALLLVFTARTAIELALLIWAAAGLVRLVRHPERVAGHGAPTPSTPTAPTERIPA